MTADSRTVKLSRDDVDALGCRQEEGWEGTFTRSDYPGALPAGTRIVKVMSEKNDRNPLGTEGTVLGSIGHPLLPNPFYFVEWDPSPKVAVGVSATKIKAKVVQ